MSKKYIEADALIKSLATETGCMDRILHAVDVADIVKDFPAADVREIVRGEWVYSEKDASWTCGSCGCVFEEIEWKPDYSFCPNCGADMRGEEHTMEEYMMGQEGNPDDGSL